MFEIGWTEMLVIAIVMIVVVGPKDLPKMLRTFGRTTSKLRTMAGDFRKQFDEALKEAELDDLKTLAEDARKLNPAGEIKKALSPMEKVAQDVRAGLDAAMKPSKPAETPSATDGLVAAEPLKTAATAMPGESATPQPAVNGAASTSEPVAAPAKIETPAPPASGKKIGPRPATPKAALTKAAVKDGATPKPTKPARKAASKGTAS